MEMPLESQKGSCALAVLKLCMWAMHLLTELPIKLHKWPGAQLHLPFQQPVLAILSRYFVGFCPSLLCPQALSPPSGTPNSWAGEAGELNICVPPETPTGFWNAGSQPPSMNHEVGRSCHTQPETHWAKLWCKGSRCGHCWAYSLP